MNNDYFYGNQHIYYKHEVSEHPESDAYSMHIHGSYELIYFVSGNATHVVEDRKYKLKPGDLILIPPLCYHYIQIDASEKYERYDILFDPEGHGVDSVSLLPDGKEVISLLDNGIATDIFKRCDLYRERCDFGMFEKILSGLLCELFYSISLFPTEENTASSSLSPIISGALKYINDNLVSVKDVGEIAAHLFVSESYLYRLFKRELYRTPKSYINEKRLLLAEKMIKSGTQPTVAYELCGFLDYTTFYRNYVAFFGRPPSRTAQAVG